MNHDEELGGLALERFLVLANGSEEQARVYYGAYLQFRTSLGEVEPSQFKEELSQGAFYFHGRTKTGSPIIVVRVVNFNPKKMTNGADSLVRLNVWVMDQVWKQNPHTQNCTLLVDCQGLSLTSLPYDAIRAVANMYNSYYPEVLFREFLINTPWLFRTAWAWLKPLLEESTRKKISILGSDYQSTLLEYILPDQLQVAYGGTSTFLPGDFTDLDTYQWDEYNEYHHRAQDLGQ